jgi:hypothetical protein
LTLINSKDNFVAGKTATKINKWRKITSDKWILQTLCGYKIELDTRPIQTVVPVPLKFSDIQFEKIDVEINRFIKSKIIEPVFSNCSDEYISNIFATPKKDGSVRIILNLKNFNRNMKFIHFKMETLKTAVNLMVKDCFFGSVDISDAYYSIPICKEDRKYLRFMYKGQKYQFCALVMGLTTAPRVYTKAMKPVFAYLRSKGHISTAYIDDTCLQGQTYTTCLKNIQDTVSLMDSLGLTVNVTKSQFVPCQQIEFVGFVLCSKTMTVRLTDKKKLAIIELCVHIISQKTITIKQFAQLIGKLVAAEPGVQYSPLFYKPLEKIKVKNLRRKCGNYNAYMKVSSDIVSGVQWWIDNLPTSVKQISHGNPMLEIHTDASILGFGACIKSQNLKTSGVWSENEKSYHINILELKACYLGLLALCSDKSHTHIRIYTDNTTCCAYINNFGGKSRVLNDIAREIWFWCIKRHIHLSAAHIPGVDNVEADTLSRKFNDDIEWSLDIEIFQTRNVSSCHGCPRMQPKFQMVL